MASKFEEILQRQRELRAQREALATIGAVSKSAIAHAAAVALDTGGFQFNEQQLEFINTALKHDMTVPYDPVILIGAAGTGKTTSVGGFIRRLQAEIALPQVRWNHKHLPTVSSGIVFCSYTRRATTNIRKRLPDDMQQNCITIHKLLEFAPVMKEVQDEKTGKWKSVRVFEPKRDRFNMLPAGLQYLIIDEFSMLGNMLWQMLKEALPTTCKVIFIGDLYQLVPVMDVSAIHEFLCKVPTIELTEVYRQALDNPIISYATQIRRGVPFAVKERQVIEAPDGKGKLTFHPWKKAVTAAYANKQLGMFFAAAYKSGQYDPLRDQILCPYDKSDTTVGNDEINRHVATAIARANNAPVFEVIGGWDKKYFAIGDCVIYDKNDAVVTNIKRNMNYMGRSPRNASTAMDYWGHMTGDKASAVSDELSDDEVERLLDMSVAMTIQDGERVRAASHVITIKLLETDEEIDLDTAGEVNALFLSYAMTVHKAQGSEWERLYLVLHACHNNTLNRELLYTGFTRPKEELYVICEPDSFIKGVSNQSIKGNTLKEKAEFLQRQAKMAAMRAASK